MTLRVVVLGCGPAGLAAVHAVATYTQDVDIRILSKGRRKSRMNGAQYLHAPIPGMGDQVPFDISYRLMGGTAADYAAKVYGAGRVSPEDVSATALVGIHPGWDIRSAYDALFATYGAYSASWDATEEPIEKFIEGWKADLWISSVPAPVLCRDSRHAFSSEFIWASDRCLPNIEDGTVLLNAASAPAWYRASLIQGQGNTEWPRRHKPPFISDRLWEVQKPIGTTCDCHPGVMRVGRYGKWKKGELVHTIYEEVQKQCEAVSQRLW